MHDCPRFVWPSSNEDYWRPKILRNVERDRKNTEMLKDLGWRILTVWECELKKKEATKTLENLAEEIRTGDKKRE